jgi:hypothetical protein
MGTDKAAIAFAAWLEAHKKHVECETRLKHAVRVNHEMGAMAPEELVEECKRLKAESDRLLSIAQGLVKAPPAQG